MNTIHIEILNPKAAKLLQDLADLNLIAIREQRPKSAFAATLHKLRSQTISAPTMEEITGEVESVRNKRYEESN